MELKISELRLLLITLASKINFNEYLSDEEVCEFNSHCRETGSAVLSTGVFVNQKICDSQSSNYDLLEIFIRILIELSKHRPLPF